MKCPDLSELARVGTPRADPAVVEHLKTCSSCWLDWLIQEGARYALDPRFESTSDLNERVIARLQIREARREKRSGWVDLAIFGGLVAATGVAFLLSSAGAGTGMSIGLGVAYAVMGGVAAGLFLRKKEDGEGSGGKGRGRWRRPMDRSGRKGRR